MGISELLNLSISAALDSGKEIMKIYKSENFGLEFKTDNSPLTLADKTANRIINNKLKKSKYLILSEEGKNISFTERKDKKKIWIVDPIDGTKEFIKKNDEFTVNIALVENGKPIIGVVFAPALKELYFAAKTIGSFKVKNVTDLKSLKENSKLNLKNLKTPEIYTLITSRSHMDFETKKFINKMKKKYDNIIIKSFGSSIKICRVADGSASCYPRFGPTMEWDTAAAHTIAEFAGCKMVDYLKKTDLIYNKSNLLNPNFIVHKI